MYLENADSVLTIDCHTFGVFTSWDRITCFDYLPYTNTTDEIEEKTAVAVIKGLTVSGWKNHKLPYPLVNLSGAEKGYIGCIFNSDVPAVVSSKLDINVPIFTAECMYGYYRNGDGGSVYNTYIDCMNEEFYANIILCALRNKYKNYVNF